MDIDVSKENIQPLRGGRNLVQLGTALQAQSDVEAQKQLQAQKEELEAAIRHYQGTDPLDPWFNYIQWVEQSYPKHGHEGHIDKLVKDCLQLFENEKKYYQDRRFVKLWIKYVDVLSNPLEIYQRLYSTGIGVECSEFYRAWACYCEESGDYKRANQVYMLGLEAKAQPLDELEQAHMNFQLFFAQRMLHDDSPTKRKAASALAETRIALTSLKSFKRRNIANVPVQRVGDSVRSTVPGVVRQQAGNFDNRLPNSNVMVNVYEDAPSTSQAAIPVGDDPGPASLVQACSNVENQKEIGIWTNPKTKMVHSKVVPHHPLPFIPYEDQGDTLRLSQNHMPYCVDDLSFTVTLCVPDPPDPTKIPCYNKTQVYVNDQEYSLEEIRSRNYNLKKKTKTEPIENIQMPQNYQNINETLAQCSALETLANCALDSEQDQLMGMAVPTLQNVTKVTNMHSPGESKVLLNMDSKEFSELSAKKSDENQKPSSTMSDKENQMMNTSHGNENAPTNYGKNNLMEEFNRSLMGNLLGDSVTVNTKEARWELRNLFNDNEPSIVQPVVQQFEVPNFDIHEDRSMTMAINTQKKGKMTDMKNFPQEKENATKFSTPVASTNPQQNMNKTAYYEDPSCTQVFNFNIKDASTPNMSQFKRPTSCIDQSKFSSVPCFVMNESGIEHNDTGLATREETSRQHAAEQHATIDNQGTALSVIMEATKENSKSGSSSSGQSTRINYQYQNQYLVDVGIGNNFISNRNEPKNNANTPRFTNSPSISQKMHNNLYVSSPEQAQIPPSCGMSDSDSIDGMTAQFGTPFQSAKVSHPLDKQKDMSKRQLQFEQRAEFQSEDSRDSVSKDSRISTVYSRPSDLHSDGYGMDVDSENSLECGAFKSTHSISLVETSDIPRPADIDFPRQIDPFNKKMLTSLLEYVKFPNKTHADGYVEVKSVPKLQLATVISVGHTKLSIDKQLGKGNYGAVFLCLDLHSNKSVAVKYQKPSRPWEFYICQELKARVKDPFMLPGYMDITTAFLGDNASLFVSEYSKYGSLLDVANKIRAATSKCINELIVILFTSEMLSIIHYLHKAQIIHADIKPDNFLLMKIPTQEWRTPSLQLIDLGCAIDMSLFPEDTTFRELIATEGFTCTEMKEGKPWTYQTDLYCLAGTIHVILMGSYMKVVNRLGQWNIDKKLPRYMKVSLWDKIFTTLLNVPDCSNLPDLMDLKNEVDSVLSGIDNLGFQLLNFANVLKSR